MSIGALGSGKKITIVTTCDELEFDIDDLRHFISEMESPLGPANPPIRKTGRSFKKPFIPTD